MIDDPIVVRKSRGLLVVSSSKPTDPIQLVRELPEGRLEVHLKNGSKYVEELQDGDDMQEIILEMMGYGTVQVIFGFHCWPEGQDGTLEFYDGAESEKDEADLEIIGEHMVSRIFNPTAYMNSKFLSLSLESVSETPDIKFYDTTYSNYDVEVCLQFRARVDQLREIGDVMEEQDSSFASYFSKGSTRMAHNDRSFSVSVVE